MQVLGRCNLLLIYNKVHKEMKNVASKDLKNMSGIHKYKTELVIFVFHIILYIF